MQRCACDSTQPSSDEDGRTYARHAYTPSISDESEHPVSPVIWRFFATSFDRVEVEEHGVGREADEFGLDFGPTGERIVFSRGIVTFSGTSDTYLPLSIVFPAGRMEVIWEGEVLSIGEEYALTRTAYTAWPNASPRLPNGVAHLVTIYGERFDRLVLTHMASDYMIRFDPAGMPLVLPTRAYYAMELAMLRDFSARFFSNAASDSRPRRVRPSTPTDSASSRPPSAQSIEYDYPDDDQSPPNDEFGDAPNSSTTGGDDNNSD